MPYKSQGAIGDAERVLLANPYRVPLQALKIREAGKFCEKRYIRINVKFCSTK